MGEGFWPPPIRNPFDDPYDRRKDDDWEWQRRLEEDEEDEYWAAKNVEDPKSIGNLLTMAMERAVAGMSYSDDMVFAKMPYCEYLKTNHWQTTRAAALERSNHQCTICCSRNNLDVHHRTYERRGHERPEDLTVLCRSCHKLFHENGRLATPDKW